MTAPNCSLCTESSELLNANWQIVTARKRQMQLMPAINQSSSNMALRSRSRIVRWRNVWWNWRSLGKGDNAMNSMLYEIVWAGNVSLFFKAFQHGRPNSNEEKVRPYRSPRTDRHAVDGNRPAIFPDVT